MSFLCFDKDICCALNCLYTLLSGTNKRFTLYYDMIFITQGVPKKGPCIEIRPFVFNVRFSYDNIGTYFKESYPTNVHCARRYDQSPFSGPPKVWNLSMSTRNPFPSVNNRTKQARFLQK